MIMKVLFIGPLNSFLTQNLIVSFHENKYELTVVNTSNNSIVESIQHCPDIQIINLYPELTKISSVSTKRTLRSKLREILIRNKTVYRLMFKFSYRKGFKSIPDINTKSKLLLLDIIEKNNFDLIYAFWGAGIFPEIKAILSQGKKTPIVHDMQSYPYGFSTVGDKFTEIPENGEILNTIEGRILASKNMFEYLNNHFQFSYGMDAILLYCFNQRYFFKTRLTPLSENDNEPHLVFIGRTDFTDRPLDDIRKNAIKIAKKGIHFHLAEPDVNLEKSEYLHYYDRADPWSLIDGSMASFMTQFDASILLYNITHKYDRFHNSFPSRFLFSLTAGIPIIMKKGYYTSCEELIKEYEIGFTYTDHDDLKMKLLNEDLMSKLKKNALKHALDGTFVFQNNFKKYHEFFCDVVDKFSNQN